MYQDYLDDIIAYYKTGKKNGRLQQRLIQPTPGSVKDECLAVCKARFQNKDLRILATFFEAGNNQDTTLRAIHRCDRDRFRPLVNFLKGITGNTDDLNIELLAWLMDFPGRPYKVEDYPETPGETENNTVSREIQSEKINDENLNKDSVDTSVGKTGRELTELSGYQNLVMKSERLASRKKIIPVVIAVLLLTLLSFYFTNKNRPADLPGTIALKMDSMGTKQHDAGISARYAGQERRVSGNHRATSDFTMKKNPLSQGKAPESETNQPKTAEKRESEPSAANLGFAAVDFASFTNLQGNADIALLIIDNNRKSMTNVASAVANLYRNKSYSVSTGVFTHVFINSKYVGEVAGGDISILSKLILPSSLKYIVVGKYTSRMDNGQRTTFICRAGLDVTVISVQEKMQVDGFELTVANGYDDEEHARAGAIEKLMDQYKARSTSIKLN